MKYQVNVNVEDVLDELGEECIKDYIITHNICLSPEEIKNHKSPKYQSWKDIDIDIDEDDFLNDMWDSDIKDYAIQNHIVTANDFSLTDLYDGDETVMIHDIIYDIKKKHRCYNKEDIKEYLNEWIDFNIN